MSDTRKVDHNLIGREAFTPVILPAGSLSGYTLGLATYNVKGYLRFETAPGFDTYAEASEAAKQHNRRMFLTDDQAHMIVATSMFPIKPVKKETI